jgi:hypothetical protein
MSFISALRFFGSTPSTEIFAVFKYTPLVHVTRICLAGKCAIEIFLDLCQLKNCRSYTDHRTFGPNLRILSRHFDGQFASVLEVSDFDVADQVDFATS